MVEVGTRIAATICSCSCATGIAAVNTTTTTVKTPRRENYSDEGYNGDDNRDNMDNLFR
jgi:hypothetical protein